MWLFVTFTILCVTKNQRKKSALNAQKTLILRRRCRLNTQQLNNFIQLFALPCPGCFSNYAAYTNNNMSKTDASDCVHVDIMSQVKRVKDRLLTTRGGGSRKKRTLRRRRHRVHATRHRRARK